MKKGKLAIVLALLVLGLGTFISKPVWLKQPMEIHLAQSGYVEGIWFPSEGPDLRFWPKHNHGIWITSTDMSWNSYRFDCIIGNALSHLADRPAIVVMPDGNKIALSDYVRKQGHWEIVN